MLSQAQGEKHLVNFQLFIFDTHTLSLPADPKQLWCTTAPPAASTRSTGERSVGSLETLYTSITAAQ